MQGDCRVTGRSNSMSLQVVEAVSCSWRRRVCSYRTSLLIHGAIMTRMRIFVIAMKFHDAIDLQLYMINVDGIDTRVKMKGVVVTVGGGSRGRSIIFNDNGLLRLFIQQLRQELCIVQARLVRIVIDNAAALLKRDLTIQRMIRRHGRRLPQNE